MKRAINRKAVLLIIVCSFVYFTAYFIRKSLAITLVNIVENTSLTTDQLGLALTGHFIAYGVMQIISGLIGDRVNPKYLIFGALISSALLNLGIFFTTNHWVIFALWLLNGVVQAFIWPPLVRFCLYNLKTSEYEGGIGFVTGGGYFGQCALCVVAALFCKYCGYRYLFLFACIFGLVVSIVWFIYSFKFNEYKHADNEKTNQETASKTKIIQVLLGFVMIFVLLSIVMQGALRDGLESWTPTFITEAFSLNSEDAIFSAMVLPLFGFTAIQLSSLIYKKKIHNPILLTIILLSICFTFVLLLNIFKNSNVWLVLTFVTMSYAFVAAGNFVLTSIMPSYFKKTGNVSTIAGVINATVYLGSALSGYGFSALTTLYGWDLGIIIWLGVSVLAIVFLVVIFRKWNNTYQKENLEEEGEANEI